MTWPGDLGAAGGRSGAGGLSCAHCTALPGAGRACRAERAPPVLPRSTHGRRVLATMMRCRCAQCDVRHLLDGAGQHASVGRGGAAQPGYRRDQRRDQPGPATGRRPGPPAPQGSGPGPSRGGQSTERSQRRGLPGQLTWFRRAGQDGERPRQVMHLRRRPGGDGAPVEDHVQQRLVVLAVGPAGEGEPRHLTMQSVRPAHEITSRLQSVTARDRPHDEFCAGGGAPVGKHRPRRPVPPLYQRSRLSHQTVWIAVRLSQPPSISCPLTPLAGLATAARTLQRLAAESSTCP